MFRDLIPGFTFRSMLRCIGFTDSEMADMFACANAHKNQLIQYGFIGFEHTSDKRCLEMSTVPFYCCVFNSINGDIVTEASFETDISETDAARIKRAIRALSIH